MLLSVAVTAFLTGVTEPLEFLFMFLAPLLYLLHALLNGISLFVATLLGIHDGVSVSAGAIDYALLYNLPAARQNVWMLLVMGVVFFAIYFVVFRLVIRMFNLKTPGREDKEDEMPERLDAAGDGGCLLRYLLRGVQVGYPHVQPENAGS